MLCTCFSCLHTEPPCEDKITSEIVLLERLVQAPPIENLAYLCLISRTYVEDFKKKLTDTLLLHKNMATMQDVVTQWLHKFWLGSTLSGLLNSYQH